MKKIRKRQRCLRRRTSLLRRWNAIHEDMKFKMVIEKTPEDFDSDVVRFMHNGKQVGHGYKAKRDGRVCIDVCPKCRKENYALAKATGYCAFCRYYANEE